MANQDLNTFSNESLNQNILTLFIKDSNNTYTITRAISEDEIITAAKTLLAKRLEKEVFIQSTRTCRDFLVTQMGRYEREVFCVLFLDNQNGVIAIEEIFSGTLNKAVIHPREVVKQALKHNAANIILAHNHPSGNLKASQADIHITQQLKQALELIDIAIIDHILVAGGDSLSFTEEGIAL